MRCQYAFYLGGAVASDPRRRGNAVSGLTQDYHLLVSAAVLGAACIATFLLGLLDALALPFSPRFVLIAGCLQGQLQRHACLAKAR